jgi:hypothetical protein
MVAGTPDSVPDDAEGSGGALSALRSQSDGDRSRWGHRLPTCRRNDMSERDQTPSPYGSRSAQEDPNPRPADQAWRDQTTPGLSPVSGGSSPVGSGAHGYVGPGENYYTTPQYSTQPVRIRRADALGALLLILAGIAAGVSLLLRWLPRDDSKGLDILKLGFKTISDKGWGEFFSSGMWQPMAVMLGGGVLFIIGLLLLVPARSHRFLGLIALLVSFAAAAGVLVPLADQNWKLGDFRVGFYFAIAVAVLGLLGSLKALLTGPKVGTTTTATS